MKNRVSLEYFYSKFYFRVKNRVGLETILLHSPLHFGIKNIYSEDEDALNYIFFFHKRRKWFVFWWTLLNLADIMWEVVRENYVFVGASNFHSSYHFVIRLSTIREFWKLKASLFSDVNCIRFSLEAFMTFCRWGKLSSP